MRRLVVVGLLLGLCAAPAWAQDAFPLSSAVLHGGAPDLASWPATVSLTRVELTAANDVGFSFQFAPDRWPNTFIPPTPVSGVPWTGPIKYTVWVCFNVQGQMECGGFVQMWPDRRSTGAPILTDNNWTRNWAYDGRWGRLAGFTPTPGTPAYLFLVAGNARAGQVPETAVRERSTIVAVRLPESGSGVWDFAATPPPPVVVPSPITPPVDLSGLATKADIERVITYQQASNDWQMRITDWLHEEAVREHESDRVFSEQLSAAMAQLREAVASIKTGATGIDYANLVTGAINALAQLVKSRQGATP